MRVLFDKIAVKTYTPAEKVGLLYVPPSSSEGQITVGQVTDIGSEVKAVRIGESVFFNRFTSTKIVADGIEYYVLKEAEVIAIV